MLQYLRIARSAAPASHADGVALLDTALRFLTLRAAARGCVDPANARGAALCRVDGTLREPALHVDVVVRGLQPCICLDLCGDPCTGLREEDCGKFQPRTWANRNGYQEAQGGLDVKLMSMYERDGSPKTMAPHAHNDPHTHTQSPRATGIARNRQKETENDRQTDPRSPLPEFTSATREAPTRSISPSQPHAIRWQTNALFATSKM